MEKINLINLNSNQNLNTQTSNPYDNLKKAYLDFVKQMSKSDFSNSPRRYIIELNLVQELKNLSSQNQEEQDIWIEKENKIRDSLLQWGVEID